MEKSNRRQFLKVTSLGSLGFISSNGTTAGTSQLSPYVTSGKASQQHNMSGYVAPKLEKVRIGYIGLGNRGPGAVERMRYIEGVEIMGLCDLVETKTVAVQNTLKGTKHRPAIYADGPYAWKAMCDRDDIDLIYIATPWEWHTPMAVYAMEAGKHVAVEVPAAKTIDECWQLVETSEKTKRHCMMLENCCYDFFELLTLNMARKGYFGTVVHAEAAYIHHLIEHNFSKEHYEGMWRLQENATRNGNLYPTHGLGPVCQLMNINRGDQMDYLTSLSCNDFTMGPHARALAEKDQFYASYANDPFRGNMNTTLIKTKSGKSIMVQHDVSSPRPYSRIHLISGTKGYAQKYPLPPKIAKGHTFLEEEERKLLEKEYNPEIVKKIKKEAKKISGSRGHGGMDFIMEWRLVDCLRNGLPLDQDVYDAALWSSIAPLSEHSVANRSVPVDIPDFTRGSWKTNTPVDVSLKEGGNTGILQQ